MSCPKRGGQEASHVFFAAGQKSCQQVMILRSPNKKHDLLQIKNMTCLEPCFAPYRNTIQSEARMLRAWRTLRTSALSRTSNMFRKARWSRIPRTSRPRWKSVSFLRSKSQRGGGHPPCNSLSDGSVPDIQDFLDILSILHVSTVPDAGHAPDAPHAPHTPDVPCVQYVRYQGGPQTCLGGPKWHPKCQNILIFNFLISFTSLILFAFSACREQSPERPIFLISKYS